MEKRDFLLSICYLSYKLAMKDVGFLDEEINDLDVLDQIDSELVNNPNFGNLSADALSKINEWKLKKRETE